MGQYTEAAKRIRAVPLESGVILPKAIRPLFPELFFLFEDYATVCRTGHAGCATPCGGIRSSSTRASTGSRGSRSAPPSRIHGRAPCLAPRHRPVIVTGRTAALGDLRTFRQRAVRRVDQACAPPDTH